MKNKLLIAALLFFTLQGMLSFKPDQEASYQAAYHSRLGRFRQAQLDLLSVIDRADLSREKDLTAVRTAIQAARNEMKPLDIWLRYLDPLAYKKINGPLPVEWETEVFEKFEKPYKREGAGLTLAALYLDEEQPLKDSLASLVRQSLAALDVYGADSTTINLREFHHFFLCNRLFLLNLAAIYTTGFECPDPDQVIPELRLMLSGVGEIYRSFNASFPATPLPDDYLDRYESALRFVSAQPEDYSRFDHFAFIRDYINPLFLQNQQLINRYHVVSRSLTDYALNKKEISIFDKALYNGQNAKGIFLRVQDPGTLAEIDGLGRMLFFDPLLSGNNQRSCASCHKPSQFLTDTSFSGSLSFDHQGALARNTPSLLNAGFNHLLMIDGKHYSLQDQVKAVIANPQEMGGDQREILAKVLSCAEYRNGFRKLLPFTPIEKEVTMDHIASAITSYYSRFSASYSPFDRAMNGQAPVTDSVRLGFNLFMSKAQCATCHFVPQFNGVKPPYIGSEFEVLGVPADRSYKKLSADSGRFLVNPAEETLRAFRTGTIRNAARTAPYMHNGVFRTLEEVVDFYDAGGGAGHGLAVPNQTLSADSLKLTVPEKKLLIAFIRSLNEDVSVDAFAGRLPPSKSKALNARKPGGTY